MKILVTCRMNQARSIVVGALLRKLYPLWQVDTFGVDALHGQFIPEMTTRLCERWNLLNFDPVSKSLKQSDVLGNYDYILTPDDYVYNRIKTHLEGKNFVCLQNFTNGIFEPAIDPEGLEDDLFASELAKICISALNWSRSMNSLSDNGKVLQIMERELSLSIKSIKTLNEFDSLTIVDTQIYRPDYEKWANMDLTVKFFNPRTLIDNKIETFNSGHEVWISEYEVDFPEHLYLSDEWQRFLKELQENCKKLALFSFPNDFPLDRKSAAILSLAFR